MPRDTRKMSRAAWRVSPLATVGVLLLILQGLPGPKAQGDLQDTICWCRSGEQGSTFGVVCEAAALAGGFCSQYYTIISGFIGQFPPGVVESLEAGEFFEARSACPGAELLECQPNQRVVGQAEQDVPRLWNLDQLDSSDDGKYAYGSLGTGVNVYVLDTGVFPRHSEFAYPEDDITAGRFSADDRRVILGTSTIQSSPSPVDCFGHGTMVAGVVAGKTFGVAKNATIIAVKTLDCEGVGDVGAVLAALQWVRANHVKPAIVQMSLATTSADLRLDAAAARLVIEGLTVVASAGNFETDVDNCSPAREPSVIAVAASNIANQPWRSSNYGTGITLFAPGSNIISSYKYVAALGRSFSKNADGTSMAAPHVSGAIALFLEHNPGASPEQVRNQLMDESVKGVLSEVREGTPNVLLRVDPEANAPLLNIVGDPEALPDVLVFPGDSTTETLDIANDGSDTLAFEVVVEVEGLFGGWLTIQPATGEVAPGGNLTLALSYDSRGLWEGQYNARIAIRSNALNSEELLQSSMLVICEDFRTDNTTGARSTVFPEQWVAVHDVIAPWVEQNGRVVDGGVSSTPSPDNASADVWVELPVRFSHPVKSLPTSSVSFPAGVVLEVNHANVRGAMCGDFFIRARVPVIPWQSSSTRVCMEIKDVVDVYGGSFKNDSTCVEVQHRPYGRLLGTQMAAYGNMAPMTSRSNVTVVAAFSHDVNVHNFTKDAFRVTGPSSASLGGLKKIHGSMPFWAITLKLPEDYFGAVTVELIHGGVVGVNGRALMPVAPLHFIRHSDALVEGNAFRMDGSPSMLATSTSVDGV